MEGNKTIKMNKEKEAKKEKLSYEELENVANQLSYANQQLQKKIQQQNVSLSITRLDFLLRIVDLSIKTNKFGEEFLANVFSEIEEAIYPKEEEKENAKQGTKTETN